MTIASPSFLRPSQQRCELPGPTVNVPYRRDYWLFLYTAKPPTKIASMTPANIKKVLSMVSSFPWKHDLERMCLPSHCVLDPWKA